MIDLWNAVNKKEIPELENPEKVTNIVDILDLNKQPKEKGLLFCLKI